MQNITGKIAFGGIAIGKIKEISKENNVVRRVKIEDAKAEIARFEAARDQAAEELKGLYDKAVKEVGEANAAIFEVHQMMLEDEDYLDSVRNIIEAQSVNAEFAVATTGDNFARYGRRLYEGTCSRCEGHLGACDPCFIAERRKGEHFWSRKRKIYHSSR